MSVSRGMFCIWADEGESWKCERCGAVVPKSVSAEKPFAGCRKGMTEMGMEFSDAVMAKPRTIPQDGPGTELKGLLSIVGITAAPNCSCNARAATMNLWGPDECERRLDEIIGWLKEEAGKRKLPFIEAAARLLVKRAISNARKAQKPPLTQ